MIRELERFREIGPGLVYGPIVDLVSDPKPVVDELGEQILGAPSGPTGWFQKLRQETLGLATVPIAHTPTFGGRSCCYEHLHLFEGRADLNYPFDTTCPCGRVFRIRLGLVRR